MKSTPMNSLQRVLTTLGQKEPDRVPMFLLLTLHGAKELGLSIKSYFSKAENVVEAQLRMQKKYNNDLLFGFYYASLEVEAFGGESIFVEDGPPNAGEPIIKQPSDILSLRVPDINHSPMLQKVLETQRQLKAVAKDEIPIIGVVMSPFSLPVMQMGFEPYLDLFLFQPKLFQQLMKINEEFCVAWANAQLAAGATAICYFDPISSNTIITPELYSLLSQPIAKRTISQIQGPTATHFASGRCHKIIDPIVDTGTAIVGVSIDENLTTLKKAIASRLTILGNLNGVEMRRWTAQEAEQAVKTAISQAGPGGGFILSDNHGEIPYQVSEDTLMAISNAVQEWGQYPLSWVESGN
jgi:uroporphyrinogen decarboxylase